ncbi:MAG: cell division cycle-associated 7 family protein [archaeon]|nr:cell division cycle-associated 7 family protein [archaeon]
MPLLVHKREETLKFPVKEKKTEEEQKEETKDKVKEEIDVIQNYFLNFWNKDKENVKNNLTQVCKDNPPETTFVSLIKPNKEIQMMELRLQMLATQIFKLQMQQFSESIRRIKRLKGFKKERKLSKAAKKDTKLLPYKVYFDESTDFPPIDLSERDFKYLFYSRDIRNCPTFIESFLINDDPNCQIVNRRYSINSRTPKRITRSEEKSIRNKNPLRVSPKKKERKSKSDERKTNISSKKEKGKQNEIPGHIIGQFLLPSFPFCHHCKLVKRPADMIECQCTKDKSRNQNKIFPQVGYSFVDQSIVIKKDKIFLLKNFEGNLPELIENYFSYKKRGTYECKKYYCKTCLRLNYNIELNSKTKKNFICPCCNSMCTCSRCIRHQDLIKIISSYINLEGDLNKLYEFLIRQNGSMYALRDHLLIGKFVVLDCATLEVRYLNVPQEDGITPEKAKEFKKLTKTYMEQIADVYESLEDREREAYCDKEIFYEDNENLKNGIKINKRRNHSKIKKEENISKKKKNKSQNKAPVYNAYVLSKLRSRKKYQDDLLSTDSINHGDSNDTIIAPPADKFLGKKRKDPLKKIKSKKKRGRTLNKRNKKKINFIPEELKENQKLNGSKLRKRSCNTVVGILTRSKIKINYESSFYSEGDEPNSNIKINKQRKVKSNKLKNKENNIIPKRRGRIPKEKKIQGRNTSQSKKKRNLSVKKNLRK